MITSWYAEWKAAFLSEFRREGRWNTSAFLLLLCLPLIYTLLLGAAYSANVLNRIPVVVCDHQQTKISRLLISNYHTSDRFTVTKQVATHEEMLAAIENGEAKVGIEIEPQLDRHIKTAVPADVGIYIDASNMVYGSASLVASEEINMNLLVSGSQRILERMTYYPDHALKTAYSAAMSVRILNNPTNGYCNFMLLGLVCNGVQISIFLYAVDFFEKDRKRHWKYKSALITGKMVAMEILSPLAFTVSLWLSHILFAVPLRGAWYEFLLLEMTFVFFFTGLGMVLALAFPSPVLALQEMLLFIMPGMLYSGLSWPNEWLDQLPTLIRMIFPITYLAMPMRDLSLAGRSELLMHSAALFASVGLLLYGISYLLLLKKSRQEVQL